MILVGEGGGVEQLVYRVGQQYRQGQHVGGVVGKEGLKQGRVAAAAVFPPQDDGKIAIGPGQIATIDAVALLAFFEAAFDADAAQDAAQIDVGLGQNRAQMRFEDRGVEAAAVEGDEHLALADVSRKILKIVAVCVGAHGFPGIVKGHGGNFVLRRAVGFDVNAGQSVTKIKKQPPGFGGGQAVAEPVGIPGGQAFLGGFEGGPPKGHFDGGQWFLGRQEIVPGQDAGRPEAAFGGGAKTGQMDKGMLEHATALRLLWSGLNSPISGKYEDGIKPAWVTPGRSFFPPALSVIPRKAAMSRENDVESAPSKTIPAAQHGSDTVISRQFFRPGPLVGDCARLANPTLPMTDADILSFLLKYFHASVFPGAETHAVSLEELSSLLGRFYDLWSEEDAGGPAAAMQGTARHLRSLADLPRAAHIFRSIANRPLAPGTVAEPFLGLDLGTGSGILLAAAWLQAKRNGVAETRLIGVEQDPVLAKRTGEIFQSIGLGDIRVADARHPGAYAALPEGPVAFVANDNVPSENARLASQPFSVIHDTLFAALAPRLKSAVFFPESLIVRHQTASLDLVLSANNRFQLPKRYHSLRCRPCSLVIEGRLMRLWQVGKDFRKYIPHNWLRIMPNRW